MDIGIAGALAAYGATAGLTSGEYPSPGPVTAVLVGAAGPALVARRSHPRPSILLALSFLAVPSLLFGSYQAGSSLLIGLTGSFSAAAYGASRWFVAIAVVGFAVVDSLALAARGAFSEFAGSVAFVVAALGAAAATGFVVCRLRALTAANIALRELVEHEAATLTHAAVEAERLRVAAELHDILSHGLGVVVLQTTAADHAWTKQPGSRSGGGAGGQSNRARCCGSAAHPALRGPRHSRWGSHAGAHLGGSRCARGGVELPRISGGSGHRRDPPTCAGCRAGLGVPSGTGGHHQRPASLRRAGLPHSDQV